MNYFKLGKDKLSKICLGTWSLGGNTKDNISYGNMSVEKCNKILNYAKNKGINFFDTANVYGESEKRLGNFFYQNREQIFISTKVGCISYKKKLNFSKKNIISQVNSSLKFTNSDYLDIVQLYNPSPNDKKIFYAIEALNELKNKKKLKYIGISLKNPHDYLFFRKIFKFDTVQCNFNLLDQRLIKKNILDLTKKDKTTLLARTILNFGIFTDSFIKSKSLNYSNEDHKSLWDIQQIINWKSFALKIRKKINIPIEDIAYRFINNYRCLKLIGATEKNHIDIALKNLNKKLSKKNIIEINSIYDEFTQIELKKREIKMKN